MAIEIGPIIRRRREWARLTQQELIDHTRLDRSSSYLGAVERGKTSPTLEELEQLARYFRLDVLDLLAEARDPRDRRPEAAETSEAPDVQQLLSLYGSLSPDDRDLALDLLACIARRRKHG